MKELRNLFFCVIALGASLLPFFTYGDYPYEIKLAIIFNFMVAILNLAGTARRSLSTGPGPFERAAERAVEGATEGTVNAIGHQVLELTETTKFVAGAIFLRLDKFESSIRKALDV